MEENSTMADTDGRTLFAGEAWFDPIEAGIRDRVCGFIEETAGAGSDGSTGRPVEARAGRRTPPGRPERNTRAPADRQLRRGAAQRAAGAPGQ